MLITLEMTKMANPSLVPCSLVCSAHFLVRNSCRRNDDNSDVAARHLVFDVGCWSGTWVWGLPLNCVGGLQTVYGFPLDGTLNINMYMYM